MSETTDFFLRAVPLCSTVGLLINWGQFVRSFRSNGPDPELPLRGILLWAIAGPLYAYIWITSMPGYVVRPGDFFVYCMLALGAVYLIFSWSRFESGGGKQLALVPTTAGRFRFAHAASLAFTAAVCAVMGPHLSPA
jgi:hypothetical protein